jgi:AraC-like DNA-binding protein
MGEGSAGAEIDARVLGGLAAEFRAAGLDPDEISRSAGMGDDGWRAAGAAVGLRQFVRLLEAAGRLAGDSGLLWRCGRLYAAAHLADLFPFACGSIDLGAALSLIVTSLNLIQGDSLVRLRTGGGLAVVEYRVLDPSIWPRSRDVEFTFGFLDGLVRRFAGPGLRPESVVFEHAPDAQGGRIDRHLGVACIYGEAVNAFAIPEQALSSRFVSNGPAVDDGERDLAALEAALQGQLQALDLPARIRQAVLARVGDGDISQRSIAASCGLSERTLRRHLLADGLGFRREIDRLRMEYAREAIARTDLPLAEIARRLGYAEQSSFTRAFHRAMGMAPTVLRRARPPAPAV